MTTYVLETGIAPPRNHTGGRPASEERKLMLSMDVGQSFLITDYHRWLFVRGIVSKIPPRKFIMRKQPGTGWRVWRTE